MSRFKKRLKKAAVIGLGLYGAGKLMGAKAAGASNVVGKTPEFRKAFAEDAVAKAKRPIVGKTKEFRGGKLLL